MLDQLITQFMTSGAANDSIAQVAQQTELDEGEARQAVQATAQGAAEAATEQGGLASMAGSLLGGGGGGLGGLAGSLLGGGAAAPANGVPPQLAQSVSGIVAQKTGLSPAIASTVVNLALPKILDYFKGAPGG